MPSISIIDEMGRWIGGSAGTAGMYPEGDAPMIEGIEDENGDESKLESIAPPLFFLLFFSCFSVNPSNPSSLECRPISPEEIDFRRATSNRLSLSNGTVLSLFRWDPRSGTAFIKCSIGRLSKSRSPILTCNQSPIQLDAILRMILPLSF